MTVTGSPWSRGSSNDRDQAGRTLVGLDLHARRTLCRSLYRGSIPRRDGFSAVPSSVASQRWAEANPASRRHYERARGSLLNGVSHDVRSTAPFPLAVARAEGSHKWDADGHELICYVMGHGSLLFGHGHPAVVDAVRAQTGVMLHPGASHELEARWAELVCDLVPSAERVRFTSSGTEASLLAFQVARARTGRDRIVKLAGHFHGWHDYASLGVDPPYRQDPPPGVAAVVAESVTVAPPDLAALERVLAEGDVAAVVLEPSGAAWTTVPLAEGLLRALRELTEAHGTLLLFDEVVTGFRWSPGGVQALTGVTPDLTTLAKVLAGGLPGGAVVGRDDVMEVLEFRGVGATKVGHPGTHNAHPLSAAAGAATLAACADGVPQREMAQRAQGLRARLNDVLDRRGARGTVYGESSTFHLVFGPDARPGTLEGVDPVSLKLGVQGQLSTELHCGMLERGVHLFHASGFLSPAHDDEDLERTVAAFDETLGELLERRLVNG